jgi:two-component system, cell cycle sensor histidine kinase and response regulator CckA
MARAMPTKPGGVEDSDDTERLRIVYAASRDFAEGTADPEALLDTIARKVAELLGCVCNVSLVSDDRRTLELAASHGPDPALLAAVRQLRARTPWTTDAPNPLLAPVHRGETAFYPVISDEMAATFGALPEALRPRSLMIAPLRARGQVIGAVSLGRSGADTRPFTDADRRLAEALADHAALGITTARLLAERAHEAERARIRSEVARELLASSVDTSALLQMLAERLAWLMGEFCAIRVVDATGTMLEPAAIYHVDPAKRIPADDPSLGPQLLGEGLSGRVVRTGASIFVPMLDREVLLGQIASRFHAFIDRMGFASLMMVPIIVRGEVLGVASLTRGTAGKPYTLDDLRLFEDLAGLAGVAISNARAAEDRRRADLALRESAETHRELFDANPMPMYVFDVETLAITAINEAALVQYGFPREELLGQPISCLWLPEETPELLAIVQQRMDVERRWTGQHRRRDGTVISVEGMSRSLRFGGRACRIVAVTDTTARLRLEEQLRQAQKMEAIGRLAGGVAHDFNNMLAVILSYTRLLQADLHAEDPIRKDLGEIEKAGERASSLTRQLLTFSRQQVVEPKPLDLDDIVETMDRMLRRLIGEDVELVTRRGGNLHRVEADPGQVEQVIMNLVVNARDAMPTGGRLAIETANVVLDEAYAKSHVGVTPGPHVMLSVTDTGCGMERETQQRIFEPFFTTKPAGKGTGLGLSTAFGIIQECRGSIWVHSEPGRGTTFKVFLPAVAGEAVTRVVAPTQASLQGTETVLLVEDEEAVRAVARRILRRRGYRVLEARSPGEAVQLAETDPSPIHLLLSDVVMPHMGGVELARRIGAMRPELKVLWMSGYTDEAVIHHGLVDASVAFIQKPFSPDALAKKVREVLEGAPGVQSFAASSMTS